MKKLFEIPEINVEKFWIEDIITTSGTEGFVPGENEGPLG